MSEDPQQQNNTEREEEAPPTRRGREDGAATNGGGRRASVEPDVVLDVSQLEVERITLEVIDLQAHVSVLAELANLVSLSLGADGQLGMVKLEIEGVKAQALLEVRLEHVRAILEKALDTIAEHPEILETLGQTLSEVLRETLGEARSTLEDVLDGLEVGDTVDEALRGRLEEVRASLEDVLERQGGGEGGAVRRAAGGVGDAARQVDEAAGRVTGGVQGAVGQTAQVAPGEAQGEMLATPSAERLAQELGVDLSTVEGTGGGGRITVKDVRSAAQGG